MKITFIKSEIPICISVLDIRYGHLRNQNNNPLYLFNDQLNYVLTYYFAKSETIKCNIS